MNISKKIILLSVFAIAMAYLEAAIVVYLRALYYSLGFKLPLAPIPNRIMITEIGREVATIIMLWAISFISGKNFKERFALFCFNFGVWDLLYYGWLKVILDWPSRWLEWDILFLIPVPWIAPWSAPALVSTALIAAALLVLIYPQRFKTHIFSGRRWMIIIGAGGFILASFFWQTARVMQTGVAEYFPWWLFWGGLLLGIITYVDQIWRQSNHS